MRDVGNHPPAGLPGWRRRVDGGRVPRQPPAPSRGDRIRSAVLFLLTLLCVYWVYGTQWMGGDPFTDPTTAAGAARFAAGLMSVLLAHEMGHYVVARRHGFSLSLPYFLPVPMAFGTFGAIIRLKSLPRTRSALLEMGAAGPLAGFAVVVLLLVLGLPGTTAMDHVQVVLPPGLTELPPPEAPSPSVLDPLWAWLDQVLSGPVGSRLLPAPPPDTRPFMILANPPIMDIVARVVIGHPPGRYDLLDPLAMAAWVGCLITAINLIPIGQLDGGHVFNALFPRWARPASKLGVAMAILAGASWLGWAVWGILLLALRAWRSLPVPLDPPPTPRARLVAACTVAAFIACFMPRPVEVEHIPVDQIEFVTAEGLPVVAPTGP